MEPINTNKSYMSVTPRSPGLSIFFMHLFKCGGTTLSNYLKEAVDPSKVCPRRFTSDFLKDLEQETDGDLFNYELYTGHFSYGIIERFPTRPFTITFLRHPIDRIISQYFHFRNEGAKVWHKLDSPGRLRSDICLNGNIDDFVLSDEIEVDVYNVNYMTRMLANQERFLIREAYLPSTLEQARKNLAHFNFIGFVEYYGESLRRLQNLLSMSEFSNFRARRVSEERKTSKIKLSKRGVDRIIEKNELDLKLYYGALEDFRL